MSESKSVAAVRSASRAADDEGGVGAELVAQPLDACQLWRPAAVEQLGKLLARQAVRA